VELPLPWNLGGRKDRRSRGAFTSLLRALGIKDAGIQQEKKLTLVRAY
jgi:hypothetical protein